MRVVSVIHRQGGDPLLAKQLEASLLKALATLTSQMTSFRVEKGTEWLNGLCQACLVSTDTPGVSVVPEMVFVSFFTLFQEYAARWGCPLDSTTRRPPSPRPRPPLAPARWRSGR